MKLRKLACNLKVCHGHDVRLWRWVNWAGLFFSFALFLSFSSFSFLHIFFGTRLLTLRNLRYVATRLYAFWKTRSAGEPCAYKRLQRKIWAAADFQNFLTRPNTRRPRKKRRLGNAEPRSTEPRRQMLLNTSWSHTSQPGLFGISGSRIRHRDFPICVFFWTQSCREVQIWIWKKKAIPGKRAWCKAFEFLSGFRLATRVLERQWTGLAPFYRWYKKMEQKVAGSIPDAQPLVTPSTHVRKQSLPVWHDERATRPYTPWHLFCCTKSSERNDVNHVGVSGNLCKTITPGANESDICRQVWSQCKQMNILAVKVAHAWASAGASRNRPRMPMHERLVNIIPTRNPQRKAGNAASSWR